MGCDDLYRFRWLAGSLYRRMCKACWLYGAEQIFIDPLGVVMLAMEYIVNSVETKLKFRTEIVEMCV